MIDEWSMMIISGDEEKNIFFFLFCDQLIIFHLNLILLACAESFAASKLSSRFCMISNNK